MILARNTIVSWGRAFALMVGLMALAGCETLDQNGPSVGTTSESNRSWIEIKKGELLTIEFRDITRDPTGDQKIEQSVQDDGTISLLLNQKVVAGGKTVGQLRDEIHDLYVPRFYNRLSVNIKRDNLFFFVGGEVKMPARIPYSGEITVTRAIQSGGDFTVYADKKRIQVIRSDGKTQTVDFYKAIKNPKLDLPIYPGDQVIVKLSWK